MTLDIDFMEAVNGTSKTIQFARTDTCGTCKGTKAKPGTSPTTCGACNGTGYNTVRSGPFVVQ
eukprot:CAMPEP_0202973828 /NCGR_PEP_ID=MMETSP1396-20130829/54427_1 /ASSEMBLY_ACC=CAM_ASM_000872 /TAXON_ID= /ORGANISM="Pseudokeronopsis sp., Strain Brazil" /LENGTH=62 /DNA_ID=CAMNT_0049706587 /DNA_START=556 /DNA_END=744 /DNA_ORIENTATION=+